MNTTRAAAAIFASLVLAGGAFGTRSSGAEEMMGRHSMEGKITSVDAKKGWVHVKTQEGTMIVHFPSSALQGVKKGDTINVDLALKDNGPEPAGAKGRQ
jgi:hypothetical protein